MSTVRMRMTKPESGTAFTDDAADVDREMALLERQLHELVGDMGGSAASVASVSSGDPPPFDVEVVRPRAVSLRRLHKLAGKELPPDTVAALGPKEPVLVHHGLTPFHPEGQRPKGIWGMGYTARLVEGDADTVGLAPETEMFEAGAIDQDVRFGLDLGGKLGLLPEAAANLGSLAAIAGVSVPGAEIEASTTQTFQLALKLKIQLLKVQSGGIGAGGARWNLYRQDERLDGFQPLAQTLNVRRGTKKLVFEVRTWAKTRGFLFGLGAKEWTSEPQRFEVALDG